MQIKISYEVVFCYGTTLETRNPAHFHLLTPPGLSVGPGAKKWNGIYVKSKIKTQAESQTAQRQHAAPGHDEGVPAGAGQNH